MGHWRWLTLILLSFTIGVPLAVPLLSFVGRQECPLHFASNTLLLVGSTLAVALPLGVAGAVLLYHTDLPLRGVLRFLTILTLFIPLPVVTTAWQAALGGGGLFPSVPWLQISDRPWAEGLAPAIWIHAQVALPWVVLIVGRGLQRIEPELEEDALLAVSALRVLWSVTLPRSAGAILAAALWVAVQVSTEMAIAEVMLVPTLAAEVYVQFGRGGGEGLAQAVATSLPVALLTAAGIYVAATRAGQVLPPIGAPVSPAHRFQLGAPRWAMFALVVSGILLLAGVPLTALVWKTGLTGQRQTWSATATVNQLLVIAPSEGPRVGWSVAVVFASAVVAATLALILCWLATDAPRYRRWLFALMALVWALPGPILGIGLEQTIQFLVLTVPWEPLSVALYDGPSPLPVMWAHQLRYLPCAVIALWPGVQLLPRDLRDSARLDGVQAMQEWWHVVFPLARSGWLAVIVIVSALALGEIGAVAGRVETPGWYTFAHELFNRMHYGVQQDVAAMCVLLVLTVAFSGAAVWALVTFLPRLATAIRPARSARR